MSSNKERGLKAWNAMKALGFTKTKVGKVVKRLFKLFDDNWEPIEEDNYRILIDAMLEDASNEPMPATTSQGVDEDPVALSHRGTNEDSGPHSSTWARQEYQHPHSSASASRYDVDVSDNESSLIKRPRMSSADRVHGRALQPASQAIMALPAVHQSGGHGEPSARVTRSKDKDLLLESPQGVLLLEESKPESEFDVRAASVDKRLNIGEYGAALSKVQSNGGSSQEEAVAPFVKPLACQRAANGIVFPGSSAPESSGPSFQNWVVPYESELPSEQRPLHDVADISKGEERVRIPIKNDFTDESCPPLFYYIRKNLVFQSAYVNTSLARIGGDNCCAGCSGNCLLAPFPCACARSTADDFAYTPEGLLRTSFIDECIAVNQFPEKHNKFYCEACPIERYKTEASPDPCKGHLARRFIKECWSKCGCDMQCGNRVVQRGITCNLQVFFTSEGKGWGLRTQDGLPKGAFICEYVGEILTSSELHGRIVENAKNGKHLHQLLLDASWGPEGAPRDEEALCIDPTFYGNVGRFVNHRCHDANLVLIPVEVETPDHRYYHLALFTAKKVEASEELTWDYGIDFDATDSTDRAFRCMCGSQYCRDRKNSRKRARAAASRN
ncbi:histone-lysine N-methyltransferase SUVR4-like isoform X2 [Lolium rigidum]|uniref:histone-lysine N-methyltransferase SUVR4-like isoform X2 n=1 Tax=Lolium rigidum TaxID=89674 RepID=UPI001F5D2FBC|nr:histone-lysine N-methyltransferase SUVR4-like isoform X2 [Lolium rigidum]